MASKSINPMLEWRPHPAQTSCEIIAGAGGKYCECSFRVYSCRENPDIIVEFEKALGCFAESAIAADHGDSGDSGFQRDASLCGCVAGSFGFVKFMIDARHYELFLDYRPCAPRVSGY